MKRGEVSNGTLAALVAVALVISVVGFYSLSSSINRFGGVTPLTGFATNNQTGYVNLTITQVLSFNMTDNYINFGTGVVTPGQDLGSCDSDGGAASNVTFNGPGCGTGGAGDWISFWNDGTLAANLTMNSSLDKVSFICQGVNDTICNSSLQLFDYKVKDPLNRCATEPSTYTPVSNISANAICTTYLPGNAAEYLNVSAFIATPKGLPTGNRQADWLFIATV